MKLVRLRKIENSEIIHYYHKGDIISSTLNLIKVNTSDFSVTIRLPISVTHKILGKSRLLRRLFRLDKCNVIRVSNKLVIIRGGIVYNYDLIEKSLLKTLDLVSCKNVLHQSICITSCGKVFFGEYGRNSNRESVNIYRSVDAGLSWEIVHSFPAGEIRHVHGCYFDLFENKIWTLTGDLNGENKILVSNLDFTDIRVYGDGSQKYRSVSIIFEQSCVHWFMDSPTEENYHFTLDRKTEQISMNSSFPGPIWYVKQLQDGICLLGTTVEIGQGVHEKYASLWLSKDLKKWELVAKFSKDCLPMPYFKWGVIGFSDGVQYSDDFVLHFEALSGLDGSSFVYKISDLC